ncbi:MAG: glycosyltransferase [Phycisphaerae bacterium]|jgi:glycosyltransferase involved in cell wall biosynthesis
MNILMMTNTYFPQVGGVSRSVKEFSDEYRKLGHKVLIIAPTYEDAPEKEDDVIRVAAIQNFNGTDFSVILPVPHLLSSQLDEFRPDVVHSHHPFLIGSTAVRVARQYNIPLVTTHHTKFEDYMHYIPVEIYHAKEFVVNLATGYENLCDCVIAPSSGIADSLRQRGVDSPIEIIPTGVRFEEFSKGSGTGFRKKHKIKKTQFVIGHVGRLEKEKNIEFLIQSVAEYLKKDKNIIFMVVGEGSYEDTIKEHFKSEGLSERLLLTGSLQGKELVNAYRAMDVFAFSSKSETQGMVLYESMAAGTPVIAIKATGVSDVLDDGENGYLVEDEQTEDFVEALSKYFSLSKEEKSRMRKNAKETAKKNSMNNCANRILGVYEKLVNKKEFRHKEDDALWQRAMEQIKAEWDMLSNVVKSAGSVLISEDTE